MRIILFSAVILAAALLMPFGPLAAEDKPPEGQIEEGTGFSMFGTESIKGFD